jgi:hypothetical protein
VRVELAFVALEATREELVLRLPDPARAEPEPASSALHELQPAVSSNAWRTAAWAALGVSAASLGTSAVTYYLGQREHAALEREGVCRGELCRASGDLGTYDALRTTQLVTLLAGVVLGAAGLSVLLLEPTAEPDAPGAQIPLALTLSPRAAQLTGHF